MSQVFYPLDDTPYLAEDAQLWLCTRTSGVYSSDADLICTAVGGMRVAVSIGIAWVKTGRLTGGVFANKDIEMFDIGMADGLLSRIDRVVVRVDAIENEPQLIVKKGQFGSSPVAPLLQRDADAYELGIHDILIRPGTIEIIQGDISDLRLNEELCGIMRDGVTGIPTQQLYDSWQSWFAAIKKDTTQKLRDILEEIEDIMTEEVAANLLMLINKNRMFGTTVTLLASDWETVDEADRPKPALTVVQAVYIPGLTPTQRIDVVNVTVGYDGPQLWPSNVDGVGTVWATESPTVDVVVKLSAQEEVQV